MCAPGVNGLLRFLDGINPLRHACRIWAILIPITLAASLGRMCHLISLLAG
jgi:hypothetical protein